MESGQRIRISGEVLYDGSSYRVASGGTIEFVGKNQSLVTVDRLDGDLNVSVFVNNSIIHEEVDER